jgi:6-pyruvoyltetrahydropterin/6-carboxytetrahydropterin synthase
MSPKNPARAPKIYLTRRATFSASHRLHSEALSEKGNQDFFGKCNRPNGHGHNYVLEVTVAGPIDQKTGVLINLVELKDIIQSEILDHVDHMHLNKDVAMFRGVNPTAENMAVVFFRVLAKALPAGILCEVRLHETENNVAVYRGE